jgi:hypothetical protein
MGVKVWRTRVNTTDLVDDAVTYAKQQNCSAASRLLGRGDAGAGDVQEIVLGTNLSISGATLNATGGGGAFELFLVFGTREVSFSG